jgi:hypothetical protein
MTTQKVYHVSIERHSITERETALFATVKRVGHAVRQYRVSDASASRLMRATHGIYTCRWPLGCGRQGWYANLDY